MPLPRDTELKLPLLLELERAGGVARLQQAAQSVRRHFPNVTAADLAMTNRDGRTLKWDNRVAWARQYLVETGQIDGSVHGQWKITDIGGQDLRQRLSSLGVSEPDLFIASPRSLAEIASPTQWNWPERQKRRGARIAHRPAGTAASPAQTQPPQPAAAGQRSAVPSRAAATSLADLIATHLDELKRGLANRMANLSADQFEELVAEFLKRLGYTEVRRVGGPGDRNIDVTASYPAPFIEVPIRVQVKHRRTSPNVGPTDVAAFRDRAGGADHLLLMVTNADFTGGAEETASEPRRQLVHLVDGKELIDSMVDKRIGVREAPMGVLEIDEHFWGQF